MKTIAKNRKKFIDKIFQNAAKCRVYTLDNGFVGKEVGCEYAKQALYRYDFAKLKEYNKLEYHVNVHANLWYEITLAEAPK